MGISKECGFQARKTYGQLTHMYEIVNKKGSLCRGLYGRIKRIKKIIHMEIHEYYRAYDVYTNLNPDEICSM